MLIPTLRTKIFQECTFTDNFIAEIQAAYAADYDPSFKTEARILKNKFDHRTSFHKNEINSAGHCVLAFNATKKAAYIEQLPIMLCSFLTALKIEKLYLMDWLSTNLHLFPFENHRKRNQFKLLAGKNSKDFGYLLQTRALSKILSLFFFAKRSDVPVIFLFSANNYMPLAINTCDDGNLHLSYPLAHDAAIKNAAKDSGFMIGGLEICSAYSTSYL